MFFCEMFWYTLSSITMPPSLLLLPNYRDIKNGQCGQTDSSLSKHKNIDL